MERHGYGTQNDTIVLIKCKLRHNQFYQNFGRQNTVIQHKNIEKYFQKIYKLDINTHKKREGFRENLTI